MTDSKDESNMNISPNSNTSKSPGGSHRKRRGSSLSVAPITPKCTLEVWLQAHKSCEQFRQRITVQEIYLSMAAICDSSKTNANEEDNQLPVEDRATSDDILIEPGMYIRSPSSMARDFTTRELPSGEKGSLLDIHALYDKETVDYLINCSAPISSSTFLYTDKQDRVYFMVGCAASFSTSLDSSHNNRPSVLQLFRADPYAANDGNDGGVREIELLCTIAMPGSVVEMVYHASQYLAVRCLPQSDVIIIDVQRITDWISTTAPPSKQSAVPATTTTTTTTTTGAGGGGGGVDGIYALDPLVRSTPLFSLEEVTVTTIPRPPSTNTSMIEPLSMCWQPYTDEDDIEYLYIGMSDSTVYSYEISREGVSRPEDGIIMSSLKCRLKSKFSDVMDREGGGKKLRSSTSSSIVENNKNVKSFAGITTIACCPYNSDLLLTYDCISTKLKFWKLPSNQYGNVTLPIHTLIVNQTPFGEKYGCSNVHWDKSGKGIYLTAGTNGNHQGRHNAKIGWLDVFNGDLIQDGKRCSSLYSWLI
jgi:hypothetical protein